MRQPVTSVAEIHHVKRVADEATPFEGADPVQSGHEANVLLRAEILVQAEKLWHVGDAAPRAPGEVHGVLAQDRDLAAGPAQGSGQHAHRGRLPGSAGTDDAENRAGADLERQVANRDLIAEGTRHVLHDDDRQSRGLGCHEALPVAILVPQTEQALAA